MSEQNRSLTGLQMAQLKAEPWHSRQLATWQPVPAPVCRTDCCDGAAVGAARCRVGAFVGADSALTPGGAQPVMRVSIEGGMTRCTEGAPVR